MTEHSNLTGLDVLDGIQMDHMPHTNELTIFHPEEPGIQVTLELVTPSRAVQLLGANHDGQRRIAAQTVHKYSADMESGDWGFVGDPIRLDAEGHIIDGQHRLYAVVQSEIAQWMLVVSGLPSQRMLALDAGKRRSLANQLQMLHYQATGEKLRNTQQVASACTFMFYWDGGNYGCDNMPRVANPKVTSAQPSHAQLISIMKKYEMLYGITFQQAAGVGLAAANKRKGIFSSIYTGLWILLSGIDKDLREKFFFELMCEDPEVVLSPAMSGLKNRMLRKGRNEVWPKWLQLHFLVSAAVALAMDQESPSFRSLPNPRWDLLANLGDIKIEASEVI